MAPWYRRFLTLACLLRLAGAPAAEAPLPPMPPVTAKDSLLIVAPHPDDESLCCAGLINLARQAGARVAIVWITSGDGNRWDAMLIDHALFPRENFYRRLASVRDDEARVAARSLAVDTDSIYFLGYPDRGVLRLMRDYYQAPTAWRSRYTGARSVIYPDAFEPGAPYNGEQLAQNFAAILDRVRPTLVFAPSVRDAHRDHRGAGLLAARVLAERGELGELRYWIVHGGNGWPAGGFEPQAPQTIAPRGAGLQWQVLRLPDDSVQVKMRAISAHQSQIRMMGHTMRRFVRSTELYAIALADPPAASHTARRPGR
jgi:LmbE family N-acetylglucosaminyl deacetylase